MMNWQSRSLGDVVEISRERIEPGETPDREFNYIGLETIEGHTGRLLPYEKARGTDIKSTKNVFHRNEVLYGKLRPYLNKVHLAGESGICSTDIFVLRTRAGEVLPEFLSNYLRSPSVLSRVSEAMTGANLPRIDQKTLLDIPMPVPPLSEQDRIVRLLDEADALRKLRAEADRRTDGLIPALFDKLFGDPDENALDWPIATAGTLMKSCDYGTSKKANEDGAGVAVLRMGNLLTDGNFDLSDLKHVELDAKELGKQLLAPGDVLFNRTNSRDLVGKTGTWDGRCEAVAASYFIRVRFDESIEHPEHFAAFMNMPALKRRLASIARGAVGQANINGKELQAIELPVPPITLQREFAQRVTDIRRLRAEQAASGEKLDALFASMLHRAFAGEL